jgi:hypothetical protein
MSMILQQIRKKICNIWGLWVKGIRKLYCFWNFSINLDFFFKIKCMWQFSPITNVDRKARTSIFISQINNPLYLLKCVMLPLHLNMISFLKIIILFSPWNAGSLGDQSLDRNRICILLSPNLSMINTQMNKQFMHVLITDTDHGK